MFFGKTFFFNAAARWTETLLVVWLAGAAWGAGPGLAARVDTFAQQVGVDAGKGSAPRVQRARSGHVTALSMPAGTAAKLKTLSAASDEATAQGFLAENSDAFFDGGKFVSFGVLRKRVQALGRAARAHVKLQQRYAGLPVWGGQAMVQVEGGGVSSVQAIMMTADPLAANPGFSTAPAISAEVAESVAIRTTPRAAGELRCTTPTLEVYDPALRHRPGKPLLAWVFEVRSTTGRTLRDQVIVDAKSGKTALRFNMIEDIKSRKIYDSVNVVGVDPGTLKRVEGGAATGITDVDQAYTYFGDTYDFYFTHHNRDSIDNAGLILSATVRFCPGPPDVCPYDNAYWDSGRMHFGAGFAAADDVVGHELTHGVTENESNLIYQDQSGAINESFSDMWGEWIDQSNTGGTDAPANKWQMGEDIPGFGVIRNMANPTIFGDPDRMGSPNFYTGNADEGGVHTNSGVGNKLCFLLTDGATFNGHTVYGFGITTASQLMYEVQTNLLTSSADYYGLYNALTQAAINLNFSQTAKNNVEQACEAVEININSSPPPPSNDLCAAAIALTANVAYTSSSLGATSNLIATCSDGSDANDVWFKYTPSVSGSITVATAGSLIDTVLSVYNSCGGTQLACNDDVNYPTVVTSSVVLTMAGGTTYYIRVAGWNGETGSYTIKVTDNGSATPTPTATPTPPPGSATPNNLSGVCINELLIDPNSASWNFDTDGNGTAATQDEFIELYNTSNTAVNITGWKLWHATQGNWFTFPTATVLGSGKFAVVLAGVQSGGTLPNPGAGSFAFAGAMTGSNSILVNGGDNVVLLNPTANRYIQAYFNSDTTDNPVSSYSGFPAGAVRVGSAEYFGTDQDGSSLGRYPDGSTTVLVYGVATSGTVLATPGVVGVPVELSGFSLE